MQLSSTLVVGPGQGAHQREQAVVVLRVQRANLVAQGILHALPRDLGDQAVGTHADRPVDPPRRHVRADGVERVRPGLHVGVHGVDEGAVDVQDDSVGRDGLHLLITCFVLSGDVPDRPLGKPGVMPGEGPHGRA